MKRCGCNRPAYLLFIASHDCPTPIYEVARERGTVAADEIQEGTDMREVTDDPKPEPQPAPEPEDGNDDGDSGEGDTAAE